MLCDSANVREGLLNVLSAGITRVFVEQFPGPLGVTLAMICEVPDGEPAVHSIVVTIKTAEGELVGRAEGGLTVDRGTLLAGESVIVPVVLPIANVGVSKPGRLDISISPDGAAGPTLEVWARQR